MHGKGEFSKIKGPVCNVSIESTDIWNILPKPADSNRLIVAKLKRDLNTEVLYTLNQYDFMQYIEHSII